MKLPAAIDDLADKAYFTKRDLWLAYYAWPELDEDGKLEYVERRLRVVKANAGKTEGVPLQTSGYQSGRRRVYNWGPGYYEMIGFHEGLKYNGLRPEVVVVLNITANADSDLAIKGPHTKIQSPYEHHSAIIKRKRLGVPNWIIGIRGAFKGKRIVFFAGPRSLEEIIESGLDLYSLSSIPIYSTGNAMLDYDVPFKKAGIVVRDGMRCWDGGATFITCKYGNKHWVDLLAHMSDKITLRTSDLMNCAEPHIDYKNGDVLEENSRSGVCRCGHAIDLIRFSQRPSFSTVIDGHVVDYTGLRNMFMTLTHGAECGRLLQFAAGIDMKSKELHVYYETEKEGKKIFDLCRAMESTIGCLGDFKTILHSDCDSARKTMFKTIPFFVV